MPRIKVVGYLNTEDLDEDEVDLDHEMGLSNDGFETYTSELGVLEDLSFRLEG